MTRDVVVVGGGPTGLMLACELRLAGVSVTVLERLPEPAESSKTLYLSGRAVDTLDHRGLLERFSEGIPLNLRRLNGGEPKFLSIEQARVEELLEERAYELGAVLRWGHELSGLQADQDGVTIDVRDPNGDYQLRTRFLVGCDGEQRVVCELAGIAFPGDALTMPVQNCAGRVFLAGDAAHMHLPDGTPEFSLGLQDAVNLGWKLAARAHGWAPPGLLDTYHAERHPAGERLLMHARVHGMLMGSGELLEHEQAPRQVGGLLQGTDVWYPMDGAGRHPLVGRWAPEITFVSRDGVRRVPQLMRRARGLLLDLAGCAALGDIAAGWADRVDVVAARCEQPSPAQALLIRPDGYVAWATDGLDRDALHGLRRALLTWFGAAYDG